MAAEYPRSWLTEGEIAEAKKKKAEELRKKEEAQDIIGRQEVRRIFEGSTAKEIHDILEVSRSLNLLDLEKVSSIDKNRIPGMLRRIQMIEDLYNERLKEEDDKRKEKGTVD